MLKARNKLLFAAFLCLVATALTAYLLAGINPDKIQAWVRNVGVWAPIIYIAIYVVATTLLLPSTALNLSGGAIFGLGIGILWTSIGALIAAVIAFLFTRTIGCDQARKRFSQSWQAMDAEISRGGLFYMFAIRLLPIIPSGVVNFSAGLTSISFKDYFLGTCLGTVPGIFPFVMLGSSGATAIKTGDLFPVLGTLLLLGCLAIATTLYRRRFVSNPKSTRLVELAKRRCHK